MKRSVFPAVGLGVLLQLLVACSETPADPNPFQGEGTPPPTPPTGAPTPPTGTPTPPTGTPTPPTGTPTPPTGTPTPPTGTPTPPTGTPTPPTAGTGGGEPMTDAGMVPDAGGQTGGDVRPPCMKDPSQVIIMGDSYIDWVSHTFPQDLVRNFGNNTAGVWDVPAEQGGRQYAKGAWAMGSGGVALIPTQLDSAISDDPDIIAAIMTGGGNDILVPGGEWPGGGECKNSAANPPLQVCQDITEKAFEAARQLMQDSADAGIRDVVYFFYPEVPAPTLVGGSNPNAILSWTYPQVKALCDETEALTQGRLRCHFLDTRPIFDGHPEYFAPTDIHPNSMGSNALTAAIADLMQERCIAQPESSGCCEP